VEVGTFYTVALSLVLALFCAYFFSVDKPGVGFLLFALILFRAFYSKAVDALFLPLKKCVDK
jgi:ABC-type glycerol-3-phosphate transport system permease component